MSVAGGDSEGALVALAVLIGLEFVITTWFIIMGAKLLPAGRSTGGKQR